MNTDTPDFPIILRLVPLAIFTLPFLILIGFIAKRKGINLLLALIVGIIPMLNIAFAFWLASRTDIAVLDRLKMLEAKK